MFAVLILAYHFGWSIQAETCGGALRWHFLRAKFTGFKYELQVGACACGKECSIACIILKTPK